MFTFVRLKLICDGAFREGTRGLAFRKPYQGPLPDSLFGTFFEHFPIWGTFVEEKAGALKRDWQTPAGIFQLIALHLLP